MMDLVRARIAADPWRAVGIAFAAGGLLALSGSRSPFARVLGTFVGAALGEIARDAARSYAHGWGDRLGRGSQRGRDRAWRARPPGLRRPLHDPPGRCVGGAGTRPAAAAA